jgi:hypothetical protein
MKDIEADTLSKCSRIFPEISSYYDPLQVVIKNLELNCLILSTLILFASIFFVKNAFPQSKENVYLHFPNFWLISIENFKSLGAKCNTQIFIESKNILYLA